MGIDSAMEAGFDGGSMKPPLESFLNDKLNGSAPETRLLKPEEARFFKTLILESGNTKIPSQEFWSTLNEKYLLSREFLAMMGPVGYSGETTVSNSDRDKVVDMASLLMALTGNSEKVAPDGKISLAELQSIIIAKLMLSARELKLQGKEIDSRLPDILVTAIDNLRGGASLKQGSSVIEPDHQFDPSKNLLNEIIPANSSGGQAFTREFPTRLKQRGGKPAAQEVDGFWLVLCGGMEGNIIPQIEKKFDIKDKLAQGRVVRSKTPPQPDYLAQHETGARRRGTPALHDRVNEQIRADKRRSGEDIT